MANEVSVTVTGRDRSGQAYASSTRGAQQMRRDVGGAADGLTGKLKGLGVAALATAGFIAVDLVKNALGKLKDMADTSVEAASNLGESMNAVEKIFGKSADKIKQWGEQNASSFGLSQRAFNALATPLGALLRNSGMALDKVADNTINLTKRAADMASVFNTDVASALDAIQAGLRGESDPLEKYGVSLSAAKIEAQALATTGKKLASQLTDQEKAAARLKLIFDQTATSAGDFQATSDGLANSTRILNARQEELQAKIGQKLLPLYTKLSQLKLTALEEIGKRAGPALDRLIKFFGQLYEKSRPIFEKAVPLIRQGMEDIKQKWEQNRESIEKLIPFLEKVGIFLGVTLLAAIGAVVVFIEGMIVWLGKAGDAWHDFERGAQMAALMVLDAAHAIASALGKIPGPMQQAFKDAAADIDRLRNKLTGLDGLEVGIGVNVKLTGLASLRDSISRAIGADLLSSGIGRRASGGLASGGVVGMLGGAAAGGLRSGMRVVGERGWELIDEGARGGHVYNHGDSVQMMLGAMRGGGGRPVVVNVYGSVVTDRQLVDVIEETVSRLGGSPSLLGLNVSEG
jgi:hypothetical protein